MGVEESTVELSENEKDIFFPGKNLQKFPYKIQKNHQINSIHVPNNKLRNFPLVLDSIRVIDISNNSLYEIQANLSELNFEFPNLEMLNLSNNGLTVLPNSILKSKRLISLDLSRNRLSAIHIHFDHLKGLNLSQNLFSTIPIVPPSVTKLDLSLNIINALSLDHINLEILDLSGNSITEVPENLFLPKIQSINLAFNQIISLPNTLQQIMPKLINLDLSYNFLQDFNYFLPPLIQSLNISHNKIRKWEAPNSSIKSLEYLKIINASFNNIEIFPPLPDSLVSFNADHNPIIDGNNISIQSNKLEEMILSNSLLETLPGFQNCPNLRKLDLNHCNITNFDSKKLPKSVTFIDFSYNSFSKIPLSFSPEMQLKSLILHGDIILKVPKKISDINLEVLVISEAPIIDLPKLPMTIKELTIASCSLEKIPLSIYALPRLNYLNLANNKIANINNKPIPSVKFLDCSHNRLNSALNLPESLEIVNLSFNQISQFSINSARNLKTLDLSNNDLHIWNLPEDFCFPLLENMNLNFNSFELPLNFQPQYFPALKFINITYAGSTDQNAKKKAQKLALKAQKQAQKAETIKPNEDQNQAKDNSNVNNINNSNENATPNESESQTVHKNENKEDKKENKKKNINKDNDELLDIDSFPNTVILSDYPGEQSKDVLIGFKIREKQDGIFIHKEIRYIQNTEDNNEKKEKPKGKDKEHGKPVHYDIISLFSGKGISGKIAASQLSNILSKENDLFQVNYGTILRKISHSLIQTQQTVSTNKTPDTSSGIIILREDNILTITHIGTERVLLVKNDCSVKQLTLDHIGKEPSELMTQKQLLLISEEDLDTKGKTNAISSAETRILGGINGVSCEVDIRKETLSENDSRIVIGNQALFKVLNNKEVGIIAVTNPNPEDAAYFIQLKASFASSEPISVIVLKL